MTVRKFSLIPLLLLLLLAGCKSQVSPPTATIAQALTTPTSLPTIVATATLLPTDTFTRTPLPSSTPTITSTPEPLPTWNISAVEIPSFPEDIYKWGITWETEQSLYIPLYEFGHQTLHLAADGSLQPEGLSPVPTPFHNLDPRTLVYSPNGTYVIECGDEANELYHSLRLYRISDDRLIAEVKDMSMSCQWSISWKQDESVLAFVTEDPQVDKYEYSRNVYLWETDGSAPYLIGKSSHFQGPPSWSPDGSKLVIQVYQPYSESPDDEFTFHILYPDSRLADTPGAQINGRDMPGLDWVTNDIVTRRTTCCAVCSFQDYYDIHTGEDIPELYWSDCFPGAGDTSETQRPQLSSDQRWIAMDKTHNNFLDENEPFDFIYTLFDLDARQPYTLSASPDHYLEFLGWSLDSQSFYLIHRPVTDTVLTNDLPFGLLSLDPRTRQFTPILPEVRYASLSPDQKYVFGLSPSEDELEGRIYSLDGTVLTDAIQFSIPEIIPPGEDALNWAIQPGLLLYEVNWSPDSARMIVEYPDGRLVLLGADHRIQILGEQIKDAWLVWSPSGERLFVLIGDKAWIVDLGY